MKFAMGTISQSLRKASLPVLMSALLLTACQDDQASGGAQVADLMAAVPADTPYVFASLSDLPDDAYKYQMGLFAPRILKILEGTRTTILADENTSDEERKQIEGVFNLANKYLSDAANWEQHRSVVYGLGMFPVARVVLEDAGEALADLQQLHQDLGTTPESESRFGGDLFKLPIEHAEMTLYYGINQGQFIATVLPEAADDLASLALGGSAPTTAYAVADLEQLAQQRGYDTGFVGFVDTLAFFDRLMSDTGAEADWLKAMAAAHQETDIDFSNVSAECKQEYRGFAEMMPHMDWGITHYEKSRVETGSFYQLRPDIAEGVLSFTGSVPGLSSDPGGDLSISTSFQVGPLRDFVLQMARNVEAAPYACENLADLNQGAQQALAQAGTTLPPFAGQIRGLKVRMDNMEASAVGGTPNMTMALFVDNAQLLVSMMQIFLPQLAEMELPTDGTPQRIDDSLGAMVPQAGSEPLFAALTESALGVALGEQQAEILPVLMDEKGSDAGILFSYFVDYKAMSDLQGDVLAKTQAEIDAEVQAKVDAGELSEEDAETRRRYEAHYQSIVADVFAIYDVFGRSGAWVKPTAEGLEVRQTQEYIDQ
jgi:hypothetical protein